MWVRALSRGRFDQFEARAQPRHLAEPITTVITDALARYRGIHHGSAVVARRLSLTFSAPDLLISGSRWVDQRHQLGTTVVA